MSGPPCGELNEFLRAKYAAIRAAEAKAKAAAVTDGFIAEMGLCMAMPSDDAWHCTQAQRDVMRAQLHAWLYGRGFRICPDGSLIKPPFEQDTF